MALKDLQLHIYTVFPQLKDYRQWCALCLVILPILSIWILNLDQKFSYQRVLISNGSWPLIISGHFAHMNFSHWLLNASAWVLLWLYARSTVPLALWVISIPLLSAGTGLGMYFLSPEINWYVGFSGVLHGLMCVVLYQLNRHYPTDPIVYIVFLGLLTKIGSEILYGPTPGTADLAGGPVVIQAHLYGLISGLATCLGAYILGFRGTPK